MEIFTNEIYGVARFAFNNPEVEDMHIIDPYLLSKNKGLSQVQKRALFPFSTVCAIFDKEHFKKFPFDNNVAWGEDLCWAVNNSNAGYPSACSSFAKVLHGHTIEEEINQHGQVNELNRKLFGEDL